MNDKNCAEYKFFCNYGRVKYVLLCTGEAHVVGKRTNDFFDRDFNHIPVKSVNMNAAELPEKPKEYAKLVELAEKISQDHLFLRVDLYLINGSIFFGELTFFHESGFVRFTPKEYDKIFGNEIILEEVESNGETKGKG